MHAPAHELILPRSRRTLDVGDDAGPEAGERAEEGPGESIEAEGVLIEDATAHVSGCQ
jgi:hypothetical protein